MTLRVRRFLPCIAEVSGNPISERNMGRITCHRSESESEFEANSTEVVEPHERTRRERRGRRIRERIRGEQ